MKKNCQTYANRAGLYGTLAMKCFMSFTNTTFPEEVPSKKARKALAGLLSGAAGVCGVTNSLHDVHNKWPSDQPVTTWHGLMTREGWPITGRMCGAIE